MLNISFYYLLCFLFWVISLFVSDKWIRQISLIISFLILIWSFYVAFIFSYYTTLFDNTVLLYEFMLWNFNYQFQIDGISILFIILSNLLLVFCLLVNWIWSINKERLL